MDSLEGHTKQAFKEYKGEPKSNFNKFTHYKNVNH